VVARGPHPSTRRALTAFHDEIFTNHFCAGTDGSEVLGDQPEAVALLHSELAHVSECGDAFRP
jgi:hypothetical protein